MCPTTTQSFFAAIAGTRPGMPAIPITLLNIARRLVRGADADAEDLVQDFILKLWGATRRGTAGSAAHLLHLSEPELRAVVRHRMRQLLAERSPHRHLRKQLGDALRRALRAGLPTVPDAPPATLLAHDRLHGPAVAAATAWVLAQPDAPAVTDVPGLVDRLREYVGREGTERDAIAHDGAAGLDAARLAHRLRTGLAAEHLQVLQARLRNQELATIAAEAGVAVSTAHARLAKAVAEVRRISEGTDAETGEAALQLLAA